MSMRDYFAEKIAAAIADEHIPEDLLRKMSYAAYDAVADAAPVSYELVDHPDFIDEDIESLARDVRIDLGAGFYQVRTVIELDRFVVRVSEDD